MRLSSLQSGTTFWARFWRSSSCTQRRRQAAMQRSIEVGSGGAPPGQMAAPAATRSARHCVGTLEAARTTCLQQRLQRLPPLLHARLLVKAARVDDLQCGGGVGAAGVSA